MPIDPNVWLAKIKGAGSVSPDILDFREASRVIADAVRAGVAKVSEVASPSRIEILRKEGVGPLAATPAEPQPDGTIAGPFEPAVNEPGPVGEAAKDMVVEPLARAAVDEAQKRGVQTTSSGYDAERKVGWAIGRNERGEIVRVEKEPDDPTPNFEDAFSAKPPPVSAPVVASDAPEPKGPPPTIKDPKPEAAPDITPNFEDAFGGGNTGEIEADSRPQPMDESLDQLYEDATRRRDAERSDMEAVRIRANRQYLSTASTTSAVPADEQVRRKKLDAENEAITRLSIPDYPDPQEVADEYLKVNPAADAQALTQWVDRQRKINDVRMYARKMADSMGYENLPWGWKILAATTGAAYTGVDAFTAGGLSAALATWKPNGVDVGDAWEVKRGAAEAMPILAPAMDAVAALVGTIGSPIMKAGGGLASALGAGRVTVGAAGFATHAATSQALREVSGQTKGEDGNAFLRILLAAEDGAAKGALMSGVTPVLTRIGERAAASMVSGTGAAAASARIRIAAAIEQAAQNAMMGFVPSIDVQGIHWADGSLKEVALQTVLGALWGGATKQRFSDVFKKELTAKGIDPEAVRVALSKSKETADDFIGPTEDPAVVHKKGGVKALDRNIEYAQQMIRRGNAEDQAHWGRVLEGLQEHRRKVAGPALDELKTIDDIDRAIEGEKARVKAIEDEILGSEADAWRKAQRMQNSSDPARSDEGARLVDQIEGRLTPEQRSRLYGEGETNLSVDDLKALRESFSGMVEGDPTEMAKRMEALLSKWDGTDAATEMALRFGFDQAKANGIDPHDLTQAIVERVAQRYPDPDDARLMAERLMGVVKGKNLGSGTAGFGIPDTPLARAAHDPDAAPRTDAEVADIEAVDSIMSGDTLPPGTPPPDGASGASAPMSPKKRRNGRLSGMADWITNRSLPRTTRVNRRAGEAGARALAAPHAVDAWLNYVGRYVLQDGAVDPVELGTALSEDNLRSVRAKAEKDAADRGVPSVVAGEVYTHIGEDGGPFATEAEYEAFLARPEVKKAIERHNEVFKKYIEPHYRALQGMKPDEPLPTRGDRTGRMNLLRNKEDDATEPTGRSRKGNPKNTEQKDSPFARTATGAAESYNGDYLAQMRNSMLRQAPDSYRKQYVDELVAGGDAVRLKKGERNVKIDGEDTVVYGIDKDLVIQKETGEVAFKQGERVAVRKSLDSEWRRIHRMDDTDPYRDYPGFKKVVDGATQASLDLTLADNIVNAVNAIGVVFSRPGTSGLPVGAETGVGMVGLDKIGTVFQVLRNWARLVRNRIDTTKTIADLEAMGAWRERGSGSGWNPLRDADTGKPAIDSWGKAANPLNWWKVASTPFRRMTERFTEAARLTMAESWDRMAARDPRLAELGEAGKRDFINQLGNYVEGTVDQTIEWLKKSGFNPLLTAAKTRISNAGGTLAGAVPLPAGRSVGGIDIGRGAGSIPYRLNMLSKWIGGAVIVGTYNYFSVGRADGRPEVPFGSIDLGYDDETGAARFFDIAEYMGLRRALRYTGTDKIIDARRRGVDDDESRKIGDAGPTNALKGLLAGGPIPMFVATASTGSNIYGYRLAEPGATASQELTNNLNAALQQAIALWEPFRTSPVGRGFTGGVNALSQGLYGHDLLKHGGDFSQALRDAMDTMAQTVSDKRGLSKKQVESMNDTYTYSRANKWEAWLKHEMLKQPIESRFEWANAQIDRYIEDVPEKHRARIGKNLREAARSVVRFK